MAEEAKELKGKQKRFADAYLGEALFNATKAAKIAGYSEKTAYSIGSRLLRNVEVSAYIEKMLESYGMGSNEVIARLAEIARGKVDDVLDENGYFNLNVARNHNKTHLLKKIKQKRTIRQRRTEVRDDMRGFLAEDEIEDIQSDVEIIYEEVEFEMYSAHEALRDLGKAHSLFTDKIEHSGGLRVDLDYQEGLDELYGDESETGKDS